MAEVLSIKRTHGECSCGEQVVRIDNCPLSCRRDGTRYDYPGRNSAWNIFRCRSCEQVIDETWSATQAAKQGGAQQ